eukprot:TRINITY_DN11845_c0_g1_i1.p1 TRINITY_DN11845_c0_g1~~TRINITY_DN11845_c0_g1_i1.p1  ORF type:complete len:166 (-),score=26.04 TRINITY_DN11845_c0_g1_i1:135-632(-)
MEDTFHSQKAEALKLYLRRRQEFVRSLEQAADTASRDLTRAQSAADSVAVSLDDAERVLSTRRSAWEQTAAAAEGQIAVAAAALPSNTALKMQTSRVNSSFPPACAAAGGCASGDQSAASSELPATPPRRPRHVGTATAPASASGEPHADPADDGPLLDAVDKDI